MIEKTLKKKKKKKKKGRDEVLIIFNKFGEGIEHSSIFYYLFFHHLGSSK
jgi:hypothetical protein